ncbi:MAG: PilZ domain-containing protein [Candidatus Sulfotelmatobacter sp.]
MSLNSPHPQPKSHHAAAVAAVGIVRNQRRSKRMGLSASVGLSGEDRLKCSFTMPARATNLNKHGAAVQLTRDLPVGSVVQLRNKNGSRVSARIVALLKASQGVSTYAIEFVEQDAAQSISGALLSRRTPNCPLAGHSNASRTLFV